MRLPYLEYGTVVSTDEDNYRVNVILDGAGIGQMPALSVEVATHGLRDGVRGNYPALPTRGTRVLLAYPRGDLRNAVVVGSVANPLNDSVGLYPGVAHADYHATFGGFWHWRDEQGFEASVWPDGSALLAGFTGVPTLTRHTLDANQARVRTPFTQAERVVAATSGTPFPWLFRHATGALAAFSASGAVLTQAAPHQALTASGNGGSVVIGPSGGITVSGASGQAVVAIANGATMTIAANGDINLDAGSHQVTVFGSKVSLGAAGGLAVARVGDPVTGGTIAAGSSVVFSA